MEKDEKTSGAPATNGVSAKLPAEHGKLRKAISSMTWDELYNYAVYDVVIPYGKKMIMDVLGKFLNTTASPSAADRTSYSTVSTLSSKNASTAVSTSISTRNVFDYEKLSFKTNDDAERALKYLQETVAIYRLARVSALYEFCNMQPSPIDFKYGWTNLDGASVTLSPGSDGYILRLPKAEPIDK